MTEHEHKEVSTEKGTSMSCPAVCKKYPHAIVAIAVILAFIIWFFCGWHSWRYNNWGWKGMQRGWSYSDWRGFWPWKMMNKNPGSSTQNVQAPQGEASNTPVGNTPTPAPINDTTVTASGAQ